MSLRLQLFLVKRTDFVDYDQYYSFIAAVGSREEAKNLSPEGKRIDWENPPRNWAMSKLALDTEYLCEAGLNVKPGVILASFRSG